MVDMGAYETKPDFDGDGDIEYEGDCDDTNPFQEYNRRNKKSIILSTLCL